MPIAKMFYNGVIYKRFSYDSILQSSYWMRTETNLIPYEKRHLVHFEIKAKSRSYISKQRKDNRYKKT
jgi:hypothetical protein